MEVRLNDPNKRAGVLLTLKHRREFVGPTPEGDATSYAEG